jgi:hypothetical protein
MKTTIFISTVIFLITGIPAFLQTSPVCLYGSSGGLAATAGGGFSFTMGEPITSGWHKNGVRVNQGFQQTYRQPVTNSASTPNLLPKFKLYPNPTPDYIIIETQETTEGYGFNLYNESGQVLQSYLVQGGYAKIDLTGYPAGTYLLQTTYQNQPYHYTIIKSSTF